MKDFSIEQAAWGWDLSMENGDIVMTSNETETIKQRLIYRIETWLRESPYDRSAGIPYDFIFGMNPVEAVAALMIQEILDTEGVIGIQGTPEILLDSTSRRLTINIDVRIGSEIVPIQTDVVA